MSQLEGLLKYFLNDTTTTELCALSLRDVLPS